MKMLLLKPLSGFSVVEANGLDDYYQHLKCDLVDSVPANVKGHQVEIICDDEGLLKENPIPSVFFNDENDGEYERCLVGNVLFSGPVDDEGELTELSKEAALAILTSAKTRLTYDKHTGHVLTWHVVVNS